MTSVCVSSGAWVAQGLAAAAGAAARGKVALLRWEGAEDAAAWAEQAPSPLATSPCAAARLLAASYDKCGAIDTPSCQMLVVASFGRARWR